MFGTTYTGGMSYRSASEINSAMARVYGHMSLAVVMSMVVSYVVGTSPELLAFFFTVRTKSASMIFLLKANDFTTSKPFFK